MECMGGALLAIILHYNFLYTCIHIRSYIARYNRILSIIYLKVLAAFTDTIRAINISYTFSGIVVKRSNQL